jgi:hypothetical protein
MSADQNLAKQKKDASESTEQSKPFLELIASWINVYTGNYGKEATEETILAWKIGLSGLQPKLLHSAFAECLRECTYWPSVAEIRAAYEKIDEIENKHYFEGYETDPKLSREEDRTLWKNLMAEFWDEHHKRNPEPMPGMRWTSEHGWLPREKSLQLEGLSHKKKVRVARP